MIMGKNKKEQLAGSKDYGLILQPMITEKSALVGGDGTTVVFKVAKKATKTEIKSAVESVFNVAVKSINICNYIGKLKRTNKSVGRRASYKKAFVTLQEGQTIDIVEGL